MKTKRAGTLLALVFLCGMAAVRGDVPGLPSQTNTMLDSWSFTDEANWTSDLGYAPVWFTNIFSVPGGGKGNALLLDTSNASPAQLVYKTTEADLNTNITFADGTISFFFNPRWSGTNQGGAGPGSWGRFVEAGSFTTNATADWWSIYTSPDGCELIFSAQSSDGSQATYLSGPLSLVSGTWNNIVVTYCTTNCAFYLNGDFVTNGVGVTLVPGATALANGFSIGSSISDGLSQARGMFAAFATYDYMLNPVEIAIEYRIAAGPNPPGGEFQPLITSAPSAPGTNGGNFDAIMGPGALLYVTNLTAGCVTSAVPWITNVIAKRVGVVTNRTTTLQFSIVGGLGGGTLYDVFGTAQLAGHKIGDAQWYWLGQGTNCATYLLTNLTDSAVYLVLGTPQDSQMSGLTDAYQLLVSKTDPNNPDPFGTGIAAWWEWLYFGTNTIDPYALCPSGDGWTLIQASQNGWNPANFYTPPAPAVTVSALPNGHVLISWQANPGPVTTYTVLRYAVTLTNVPATQLSFEDDSVQVNAATLGLPSYQVQANYPQSPSNRSAAQQPVDPTLAVSTFLARGPQGQYFLLAPNIPPRATALLFFVTLVNSYEYPQLNALSYQQPASTFTPGGVPGYFEVPAASFNQGQYAVPNSILPFYGGYNLSCHAVGTNGTFGPVTDTSQPFTDSTGALIPFIDGRVQLKQNLVFALEAADQSGQFQFMIPGFGIPAPPLYVFPANYVCASYHFPVDYGEAQLVGSLVDEFKPFEDNFFLRNFLYAPTNLNSDGSLLSGVYYDSSSSPPINIPAQTLFSFPEYSYLTTGNTSLLAAQMSATNAQWVYADLPANVGIQQSYPSLYLPSGQQNVFGLVYQSAHRVYNDGVSVHDDPLAAGGSIPDTNGAPEFFYAQAAPPQLQTVGYFFGVPNRDYLPGNAGFNPGETVPPIICPLGQPFAISGWAIQTVNGSSSNPAYLEQYFDKACTIDTNGVTTNSAGLLSPYGDFFPTQPGPAALVTMPDIETGQFGTGVVQVIALCTDANHDGTIDPTFFGPDFTSTNHPFRFWTHSTDDHGDDGGDGIPGTTNGWRNQYGNVYYDSVNGTRNLGDFFPVYIDVQSLLQSQSSLPNLTFRLTQADSALLVVETQLTRTNYMNFLTDTNTANTLAYARTGRVYSQGYALDTNFLAGIRDGGKGIILVEASWPTSAPLVLEVWQGTNMIAQSSLYLNISDIEQMFRHKNLMLGQTATDPRAPADRLAASDVPNEPDNNGKNFVFVHGYNVNPNAARGAFADVFKRMCWSGSHAKFYGVTWFGSDTQGQLPLLSGVTPNYHTNVGHAFQTATSLATFLATLTNGPTVVAAHSLGNMVVLSAINDWNAPISQYYMIDAAVAVEALQGNVQETSTMYYSDWLAYVDRLNSHEWHNLFPTNDGRSLLTWSNRLASFHNTDVFNFYSSGEEVLRSFGGDPPSDLLSSLIPQIESAIAGAQGSYAWVWQEKAKGRAYYDDFLGSTHGGWRFNYRYDTNNAHLSPGQASLLSSAQLQTNAFFDFGTGTFGGPDLALQSANGSQYAQTNGNRILADGIPALTLPVGANPVPAFNALNRNFNMQILYENNWPADRLATSELNNWHHSDFRQVAYTFTYKLYNDFVSFGILK